MMTSSKTEKRIKKILSSEVALGRIDFFFMGSDSIKVDGIELPTIVIYAEYIDNSIRGTQEGREILENELFNIIDPTLCFIDFQWAKGDK